MTKAYDYCKKNVRKKTTPKYVKKQMRSFMNIEDGKDKKYMIDLDKYNRIENALKLLIMPKGLKAGQILYECTTGYQWLIYTAVLCTVYRDRPNVRRYETCILEICRKNFKTFTVATLFIILFMTEPRFSEFFSVAPDGKLSREIKDAITNTIKSSPLVYSHNGIKRFKLQRDYIYFMPLESRYTPLNYSNSNMDGKLPNVFCADEVGALPSTYAVEAMQSGQMNILNKLGFIISTKYPSINNPIETYEAYAKKVLDGIIKDETIFALLYVPDETTGWETNDNILKQANPVALEIPEVWKDLKKKRAKAIAMEDVRENFVTKHCNIIYQGAGTQTFIDVGDVQKCRTNKIDWSGRTVYIGLDLSQSIDNTSVAMLSVEGDTVLAEAWAFIPDGRIDEKNAVEKIDYREYIRKGNAIACGDRVIDYGAIESFIMSIEQKYNVRIQAIGYDRWNAMSSAQKLETAGFNVIEIRQHSSTLHPPTKRLREKILQGEFAYHDNKLLELNFENARCTYDTNKNLYINKKKSNGKIDMVVAIINAMYLVEQDYFLNQMDFVCQVIDI